MKTILCVIRTSTEEQETASQKKDMLEFCISRGFKEEDIEWIEVAGASKVCADDCSDKINHSEQS